MFYRTVSFLYAMRSERHFVDFYRFIHSGIGDASLGFESGSAVFDVSPFIIIDFSGFVIQIGLSADFFRKRFILIQFLPIHIADADQPASFDYRSAVSVFGNAVCYGASSEIKGVCAVFPYGQCRIVIETYGSLFGFRGQRGLSRHFLFYGRSGGGRRTLFNSSRILFNAG